MQSTLSGFYPNKDKRGKRHHVGQLVEQCIGDPRAHGAVRHGLLGFREQPVGRDPGDCQGAAWRSVEITYVCFILHVTLVRLNQAFVITQTHRYGYFSCIIQAVIGWLHLFSKPNLATVVTLTLVSYTLNSVLSYSSTSVVVSPWQVNVKIKCKCVELIITLAAGLNVLRRRSPVSHWELLIWHQTHAQ